MCDILGDLDILRSLSISQEIVKEFRRLITVYLGTNIYNFRGVTYEFKDGLPMAGSPPSLLVADVFMNNLEDNFLCSHTQFNNHVHTWLRYVDDIFCVGSGEQNDINQFFNLLNTQHPDNKFTYEPGVHQLNYLDLNLKL